MPSSTDMVYGDADFIFQQSLAPSHTARSTIPGLMTMASLCLIWSTNWVELYRESTLYCQEEIERHKWRLLLKKPGQQSHRLIASIAHCIDAVNNAKGAPTKN
ncbi:hypothetical protein CHARACLAT_026095 [Characodon lateralis]|uniref:Uncharacterized protein n=1 Tax=Characodon lateralis TaxID=208331 RepID=A0ABU7DMV5_9TELE|nr:hypothetical protein [Characodon lateralis]